MKLGTRGAVKKSFEKGTSIQATRGKAEDGRKRIGMTEDDGGMARARPKAGGGTTVGRTADMKAEDGRTKIGVTGDGRRARAGTVAGRGAGAEDRG
mmetsp:Transcript_478/g.726  ORF Transcript_478/g.726 Transcript_478/m.726 type:complete len:96 (-) Transcript_478:82-369(-)